MLNRTVSNIPWKRTFRCTVVGATLSMGIFCMALIQTLMMTFSVHCTGIFAILKDLLGITVSPIIDGASVHSTESFSELRQNNTELVREYDSPLCITLKFKQIS